ncbi:hypothetical protein MNEG_6531 [Monoraphidium neglectum]|uniref:Uncharacterized protein n=1 Tax=Monoraphidium neglectum TaxID=145388 RepID=A0A0D2JQP9_9CHLO|nr:hypothetical protein MNEG_6531 [Monoraphidium neglectum]KIZ01428.1 hypothetical protein MNEG_6531 [Monoraphidium neglectum]|eukprot:XP_013900447.1 hypothetical protein MNEG_6531 [Monoraphidium neglectum]
MVALSQARGLLADVTVPAHAAAPPTAQAAPRDSVLSDDVFGDLELADAPESASISAAAATAVRFLADATVSSTAGRQAPEVVPDDEAAAAQKKAGPPSSRLVDGDGEAVEKLQRLLVESSPFVLQLTSLVASLRDIHTRPAPPTAPVLPSPSPTPPEPAPLPAAPHTSSPAAVACNESTDLPSGGGSCGGGRGDNATTNGICCGDEVDIEAITCALLSEGYLVQLRCDAAGGERPRDARRCLQQLRHSFVVCLGGPAAPTPRSGGAVAGAVADGGAAAAASEYLPAPLVIEPRFRDQFVIAHPTAAYASLLAAAPPCFVGSAAKLEAVVSHLADEMAAAFTQRRHGAVPPWRTRAAMLSKWGPQQLAALAAKMPGAREGGGGVGGDGAAAAEVAAWLPEASVLDGSVGGRGAPLSPHGAAGGAWRAAAHAREQQLALQPRIYQILASAAAAGPLRPSPTPAGEGPAACPGATTTAGTAAPPPAPAAVAALQAADASSLGRALQALTAAFGGAARGLSCAGGGSVMAQPQGAQPAALRFSRKASYEWCERRQGSGKARSLLAAALQTSAGAGCGAADGSGAGGRGAQQAEARPAIRVVQNEPAQQQPAATGASPAAAPPPLPPLPGGSFF